MAAESIIIKNSNGRSHHDSRKKVDKIWTSLCCPRLWGMRYASGPMSIARDIGDDFSSLSAVQILNYWFISWIHADVFLWNIIS